MPDMNHFEQPQKRQAEFITPPNLLKQKVGFGGLKDDILDKAQALLENNATDFRPLGEMYLDSMEKGIKYAKRSITTEDSEALIATILFPAMQLKANGGMFHYPLVTRIADRLIQFLEVIDAPDKDALEIVAAFQSTIKAILMGQVKGDGGQYGKELEKALVDACFRYFGKHPENKTELPN